MPEYVVIFLAGIVISILSILLGRREKRILENAIPVTATVVSYDEYYDAANIDANQIQDRMYTAVMSYTTIDGTTIEAKEQCGRGSKKYEIGQEIDIEYSAIKPDFFIVSGDHSRKVAFVAMFLFGFVMMAIAIVMYTKAG